jgi:perosamine synthetase
MPGYNYHMTEFQAALGTTRLAKLERILKRRREIAATYGRSLKDSPLQPPFVPTGNEPVFQSYVCLLPKDAAPRRSEMIRNLREQGVETTIGTWHMPLPSYCRKRYGYKPGDFLVTDEVFARALPLPMYEGLTPGDQERVVELLSRNLV